MGDVGAFAAFVQPDAAGRKQQKIESLLGVIIFLIPYSSHVVEGR